jgi:hypothetical protein
MCPTPGHKIIRPPHQRLILLNGPCCFPLGLFQSFGTTKIPGIQETFEFLWQAVNTCQQRLTNPLKERHNGAQDHFTPEENMKLGTAGYRLFRDRYDAEVKVRDHTTLELPRRYVTPASGDV